MHKNRRGPSQAENTARLTWIIFVIRSNDMRQPRLPRRDRVDGHRPLDYRTLLRFAMIPS